MKRLHYVLLIGEENVWSIPVFVDPEDVSLQQTDGVPIVRYPFTTLWDEIKHRFFPRGKLHAFIVEGETQEWTFTTYLVTRPENNEVAQMKNDGITCFYEVANTVPAWVVERGYTRIWCILQDICNFRWKELLIDKSKLITQK